MKVQILVTKSCSHCASLQHELRDIGIPFDVIYVEEHPELVSAHGIRHSPNILVNDRVVFRGQPTLQELRTLFGEG